MLWQAKSPALSPVLLVVSFCVIATGVGVGTYVAYGLRREDTHTPPMLTPEQRPPIEPELRFAVGVGAKFPDISVTTIDGGVKPLDAFVAGKPTVLLFWHLDCTPCIEQAYTWRKYMYPVIKKDVQQLVCLPASNQDKLTEYQAVFKGKTVVFVDYADLRHSYNLALSPTIISLDGRSLITHIQYESWVFLDQEFYELLSDVRLGKT